MRKLTNILAPLLKKYRYRNKLDPFKLFEDFNKNNIIDKENKGDVLLLPLRVSPTSNVFEGLIGYALKLRGYKVHALMCGQSLSKCENVNQRNFFSLACSLCNYEQKRFSKAYDINHVEYLEEVDTTEQEKLFTLSITTKLEDIFNYTYKNVSIGKHVEGGVSRYLLLSNIDLKKYENLVREYFFTSLLTVAATKSILRKIKPKFIIASHGIYSTWGAAVDTCLADGYHVVVWGRGYVGQGNIVASHNASYLFDTINEKSDYWKNSIVAPETKKELDSYFENKRNLRAEVDHVNYYADVEENNEDIFSTLKIDKNRHRIGIYPNIPWDGKMFSATEDFPNLNIFVRAVLEWAYKNPKVDLIIRAHPAEAYRKGNESIERFIDIVKMECDILPDNIIYIEPTAPINSYQLSDICDAALMYASTLALEFAYMQHPVIQVGLNNVSNKGLIFDALNKQQMFQFLDESVNNNLVVDDSMQTRVVQYADYWVNKRHIPETLIKLSHLAFNGYTFDGSNKLSKGNYKVLDWFIDRCEDGKPFIWECNPLKINTQSK
jgi:hypothetical protein